MIKPVWRLSRGGAIAGGLFLALPVVIFTWVFLVASKNPAESGESALVLMLFAMPWVTMLPAGWLGPVTGVMCMLVNAFIIYAIFGGLRLKKI